MIEYDQCTAEVRRCAPGIKSTWFIIPEELNLKSSLGSLFGISVFVRARAHVCVCVCVCVCV